MGNDSKFGDEAPVLAGRKLKRVGSYLYGVRRPRWSLTAWRWAGNKYRVTLIWTTGDTLPRGGMGSDVGDVQSEVTCLDEFEAAIANVLSRAPERIRDEWEIAR